MKTKQEKTIASIFCIILITLMTLNIIIWHQNQKSIEQIKKNAIEKVDSIKK